jgi:alpha-ketoglutarate-dependent taurine dioxygenase
VESRLKKQGYAFIRGAGITNSEKLKLLHPVLFPKSIYDYHQQGGIYHGTRKEVFGVYEFFNVKTRFWNMAVHHDLSYRLVIPSRGCIAHYHKAEEGGNTPLYDNRVLWYDFMNLYYDLMLELSQEGIIYIKNLPDEKNQVKTLLWREADITPWQENYPNMTPSQITSTIEQRGETAQWQDDGTLRVSCHIPAFRVHPITGERFYCNQILSWDARNFWQWPGQPFEKYAFIDRPTHAQIGNGRDLTDEEYLGLLELHNRYAMSTPWENGDIVVWDNIRISHSRDPYKGERRLAISWGD